MKKTSLMCWLIVWCLSFWAKAQQYSFRTYSLDEGLPQSEILDLLQDQRGVIWVATNGGGVCRFNGVEFMVINQSEGLIHNRVRKLFQNSQGNLWFITERGASYYDGIKIKNFAEKEGFPSGIDFEVLEDKKGRLWCLVHREEKISKLIYFDNNQFIDFSYKYLNLIQNNQINSIGLDGQNNLLIETNQGLFKFHDEKLDKFQSENLELLKNKRIKFLLTDSNKKLWLLATDVTTKNTQLMAYTPQGTQVFDFPAELGIDIKKILGAYQGKDGTYWFSVATLGLIKYQKNTFQLISSQNGLPSTYITTILEDKNKNLWLGTSTGLLKFRGEHFIGFSEKEGLESNTVWVIYQKPGDSRYWFGTQGKSGLSFMDIRTNTIQKVNAPFGQYLGRVKCMATLNSGTFLLGTNNGLYEYNGTILKNVNEQYGLSSNSINITDLLITKNNHLWITTFQEGVYHFDGVSSEHFTVQNKNLVSNVVNDVYEDYKGNIWFCTNYGISMYDGGKITNFTKKEGVNNDYVFQATNDKEGNLWFATLGGLMSFSQKTQKFTLHSLENDLTHNAAYGVLLDKHNTLWVSMQSGVSKLTLQAGQITKAIKYSKTEGFMGLENKNNALYEDHQGNIWFGTVNGAVMYRSQLDYRTIQTPQVNINDIQLFFQKTNWTAKEYKSYHTGIIPWSNLPENLHLPHDQNYISFDFESLDYFSQKNVYYQWILEGIDEDWTPPSRKTEAVYTNLPPGKYSFKVRASLKKDQWDDQPPTVYTFYIDPAFWQTWWFYALVFAAAFTLIATFIINRFRNISSQKVYLEEKIAEASAELLERNEKLSKQTEEIEKQRKELEQSNFTKDRFFSILAHDIRGPLNSLTAFLDIMSNHLDQMTKEDLLFMSSSLNRSVKNLYSLLENVLSWSRSQMGVLEYKLAHTPILPLIENAVNLLEVSATNKNISLHIENVPEEMAIYADSNAIQTVIRNLVSNAIKFTMPDGKVTVSAQEKEGFVEVSVADTGVGMSKEAQEKVFRIDTRYSTKGTANEIGTGLGLVLVKEFVEKNGGKIRVQSEEGVGTTFTFSVPVSKEVLINESSQAHNS